MRQCSGRINESYRLFYCVRTGSRYGKRYSFRGGGGSVSVTTDRRYVIEDIAVSLRQAFVLAAGLFFCADNEAPNGIYELDILGFQ